MAMKTVETLLGKATNMGGFHMLPKDESAMLAKLSNLAETYEDNTMQLLPIQPKTLQEAVNLKWQNKNYHSQACEKTLYRCA
jgi:hypothetical protein